MTSVSEWFNFSNIKNWKLFTVFSKTSVSRNPEDELARTLSRFEEYLFHIQNILIWENPAVSALSVLAVNIVFWFLVNYEFRFYGVLFTVVLCIVSHKMWTDSIWPEIAVPSPKKKESGDWIPQHPGGVLSVPEISSYLIRSKDLFRSYYNYLRRLREEQPMVFCCKICGVFGILALIGRTIPGSVIGYCVLMLLMIGPGVYLHVLPPWAVDKLTEIWHVLASKQDRENDSEPEDLLPEATNENLALFQLAGEPDNSSDREDTLEFGLDPSSSLTGLSMSHQMDDSSPDDLDDLALSRRSDSDVGIRFRSSHFNGDSSEEEESAFAEGLTFTDGGSSQTQHPAHAAPSAAALMSGLSTLGATLVSSVLSRATTVAAAPSAPRRSSSEESDEFELIDKSELS